MATKKTDTGKKETASKKKTTSAAKKATPNAKNAIEAPDLATMPDEIKRVLGENATLDAAHEPAIEYLPPALMTKIMTDVAQLMYQFQQA